MKKNMITFGLLVGGLLTSQSLLAQLTPLDKASANAAKTAATTGSQTLFAMKGDSLAKASTEDKLVKSLQDDASALSIDPIDLNVSSLEAGNSSFYINLGPGEVYSVNQSNSYWLNQDYQAWSGTVNVGGETTKGGNNQNLAVFVRSDNRVFGQFRVDNRVFEVMTTEDGKHVLVERDFSRLPDGDDTPKKELPTKFAKSSGLAGIMMTSTTIRVLQGATTTALTRYGNTAVRDRMSFFIAQSNAAYAANGLAITLQDAGKYDTGQADRSSMESNVSSLKNLTDGWYDSLAGSLRNSQSADIVVIVSDNPGSSVCGVVDAIGGGQSNGFFAQRYSCTDYTFVHELAHLFGSRHDNDPTTTPFSYGHGFVNTAGNFRSIMAVNSNPQPRVGLFSTDDQLYQGLPIGNASFADNERVHAERASTMAAFR